MNDPQAIRDYQRDTNAPTHPMHGRFVFRNIGPIDHAEMELGNLTVIAGHNNTGKTYLAYSLYGFLRSWNQSPHLYTDIAYSEKSDTSRLEPKSQDKLLIIDRLIAAAATKGYARDSISNRQWNEDRRAISDKFSFHFSKEILPDIFSSSPDLFKDSSVTVNILDASMPDSTQFHAFPSGLTISFSVRDDSIVLSYDDQKQLLDVSGNYRGIVDRYIRTLFPEFRHYTSVFSSERFGISLFYRELDFNRSQVINLIQRMLRRNRGTDHSADSLSHLIYRKTNQYALPIMDNIAYTRSIPDFLTQTSDFFDESLYSEVEKIVKGYYVSEEGELRFKSSSDQERPFDLPLHMASSSARGMSDLYFFLRHVAKQRHMLIIDEPESHLDTANQVLLARLLSRFVQSGIRVLITTHSDYLLKELNNLIMLSSDFIDRNKVMRELEYSKHDALDPSAIRGYIAQNQTLIECSVDEFGVDWPVFDSTIDKINQASNELSYRVRGRIRD